MRKVLSFSGFLMLGLVVSQFLPMMAGDGYGAVKSVSNVLLYVCLSFIMINVGREFVLDKTRWKSYAQDYFIAMATLLLFPPSASSPSPFPARMKSTLFSPRVVA